MIGLLNDKFNKGFSIMKNLINCLKTAKALQFIVLLGSFSGVNLFSMTSMTEMGK